MVSVPNDCPTVSAFGTLVFLCKFLIIILLEAFFAGCPTLCGCMDGTVGQKPYSFENPPYQGPVGTS